MDVSDGHGGVGGRLIGCGEVGRNRQVSGNRGMDRSSQVIRGMGMSNQASEWTIGHDEWTQRGMGRSGQMQRGKNLLLVLTVKLLLIVQKLQAIKYKNDDCVAQWLKTSWAMSG